MGCGSSRAVDIASKRPDSLDAFDTPDADGDGASHLRPWAHSKAGWEAQGEDYRRPPIPVDDKHRCEVAASYAAAALRSKADGCLSRLCELPNPILGTTLCAVGLIGRATHRFCAVSTPLKLPPDIARKNGFDRHETCCNVTVKLGRTVVVADLSKDPVLAHYPIAEMGFKFYASAPLRSAEGIVIGTVCVYGASPREDFGSMETGVLETVAASVVTELETRKARLEGEASSTRQAALSAAVTAKAARTAASDRIVHGAAHSAGAPTYGSNSASTGAAADTRATGQFVRRGGGGGSRSNIITPSGAGSDDKVSITSATLSDSPGDKGEEWISAAAPVGAGVIGGTAMRRQSRGSSGKGSTPTASPPPTHVARGAATPSPTPPAAPPQSISVASVDATAPSAAPSTPSPEPLAAPVHAKEQAKLNASSRSAAPESLRATMETIVDFQTEAYYRMTNNAERWWALKTFLKGSSTQIPRESECESWYDPTPLLRSGFKSLAVNTGMT